jgi:CBS domain-containing protein
MRKIKPDVIAKEQHLLTLPESASVREAARRMQRRDVRCVLVASRGVLKGIFTGTDLIRLVAEAVDLDNTPLSQVMTRSPHTISPDALAVEALRCMQDGRFRHLPVVDKGKLVGIVSRRDFLGYEVDEIERENELWEKV